MEPGIIIIQIIQVMKAPVTMSMLKKKNGGTLNAGSNLKRLGKKWC